jgi:hypothetical protein
VKKKSRQDVGNREASCECKEFPGVSDRVRLSGQGGRDLCAVDLSLKSIQGLKLRWV